MMNKKSIAQLLILGFPLWLGCVDKVNLSLPSGKLPFIIEGFVSDQAGPDTVKISKAFPVDGNYYSRVGVDGANLTITDDAGNTDGLTGIGKGFYVTNTLVGTIGRTYTLRGTLPGGIGIESTAERMAPAGNLDSIYYEYTETENTNTGVLEPGFNVYVNSTFDPSSSLRIRWKFYGTYKLVTDPSLIQTPRPLACAERCQCCVCFASEFETTPIVSDTRTAGSTSINRTFIHFIPISNYTFNDRYRVEVTQMEISQPVYDFYFDLKRQIINAASLFQPPFFELNGNVRALNSGANVIGVFSAAALIKKYIYIKKSAVPFELVSEAIAGDCRSVVENSTTTVPPFWN
ncbi:MAG: DUF4249 family protein [Cyclobacteriaceae bacterium]|nr:DUF4249 family protein [Cyclobacteriaceae bacterium]